MAWTARITDKTFDNDVLHVTVELKEGKRIVTTVYSIQNAQSADWLKERIAEKVAVLESLATYEDSLVKGVFDFSLVPKEAPVMSAEDLERQAFAQKVRQLRRIENAVNAGVKTEEDLMTIQAEVKLLYKEEFADLL